jgi:hypothetical protein
VAFSWITRTAFGVFAVLLGLSSWLPSKATAQIEQLLPASAKEWRHASSGDVLLLKEDVTTRRLAEPVTTERFEGKVGGIAAITLVIPQGTQLVKIGYEPLCTSVPVLPGLFGYPPFPICLFDSDNDGMLDRYRTTFQNEVQPQVYRLRGQVKYDPSPQVELSYFKREAALVGVTEAESVIVYREHISRFGPPDFEVALRYRGSALYPEMWDVQGAMIEVASVDDGFSFRLAKDWGAPDDLANDVSVQRPFMDEKGPFGLVWGSANNTGQLSGQDNLTAGSGTTDTTKSEGPLPEALRSCARAVLHPANDAPASYGLVYSDQALSSPGVSENAAQADVYMGGDLNFRIISQNILGVELQLCGAFLDDRLFMIDMPAGDLDETKLTQLFFALDRSYPQNSKDCVQGNRCTSRWWKDDEKRVFIQARDGRVQYTYAPLKREFLVRWARHYASFIEQAGDGLDLGR